MTLEEYVKLKIEECEDFKGNYRLEQYMLDVIDREIETLQSLLEGYDNYCRAHKERQE